MANTRMKNFPPFLLEMEAKKAKIVTVAGIIFLIILLIIARARLGLSKAFYLIAGIVIAAILFIFTWVLVQFCVNRWRKLLERNLVLEQQELQTEHSFLRKVAGVPTKFNYNELEAATDNFRSLIGRGGSASVFKGIFDNGTQVAVKRIIGEQHGEKAFRAEVAAIASVQHVNLVRLLGYCCVPGGTRFLVYDFIYNGSLEAWIFPRRGCNNGRMGCLPWDLRYRVAIDVAKALAYLHHDCRSKILHLDVKPENILLDKNFRALVSDFGLSKLMGKDESEVVTTLRGTRGYLAPEWLLEHGISEKSDVYSYGMVLLEIVSGRRNVCLMEDGDEYQRKWPYFPRIVTEKVREGKVLEVVDERLVEDGGVDEGEVRVLINVALWCIQENARLRPSMGRVVEMLEGRMAVEQPPETKMIIVDLWSSFHESSDGYNGAIGSL